MSSEGTPSLTGKQEQFCQEYLIDLNATRSAVRAGYPARSASVTGCRLLINAKVHARITELRKEIGERCRVNQDRIIEEYSKLAFTNLEDVMDWADGDLKLRNGDDISASAHGAISEVIRTETPTGIITLRVKLMDKKGALDSLAKYFGMITDKLEHSGTVKTENTFCIEFIDNRQSN